MFLKRINDMRKIISQNKLDGLMIQQRENYIYLSGFNGTFACLLITLEDLILITDSRYIDQAKHQAELFEIIKYDTSLLNSLNKIVKDKNIEILGFESGFITYEKYLTYKKYLKIKELVPLKETAEVLRAIKDNAEIEKIKIAIKIADNAFWHILNYIKPGVPEVEIAAELECFMRKQGAKGVSFETIVASGIRSSLPHGIASEKLIEFGDVVLMDFGAVFDDYCSDITRTVFVGEPNEQLKKVYEIVLNSQKHAINNIQDGMTGKDIDSLARNVISEYGYDRNFGHGLGHGVGINVHETPRISPSGNDSIKNGMVFTIEPGIYLSNCGGVRIEDMVFIDKGEATVLTESCKDLIIL